MNLPGRQSCFGVKEYMLKPIDIKELQDTLLRVLAELKGEDGIADREVRREYVIRQIRAEGSSQNASKEAIGRSGKAISDRKF